MRSRVYSVDAIKLALTKSKPPQIVLHVTGMVTSSGWSQPELAPWVYIQPPKDGILDLDFTAEQPTGFVLPVILPISASLVVAVPDWVKGVRIHTSTNTQTALLEEAAGVATKGDEDPYPWFAPT